MSRLGTSQPPKDELNGGKARRGSAEGCVAEAERLPKTPCSFQTKFFTVLFHFPPAAGCTVVVFNSTIGWGSDLPKAELGGLGLELRSSGSKAHTFNPRVVALPQKADVSQQRDCPPRVQNVKIDAQ